MGMGGQRQASVSIVQEAVWAPGPVWTGVENIAPHRDFFFPPFVEYFSVVHQPKSGLDRLTVKSF
jgi:hypothetical protein